MIRPEECGCVMWLGLHAVGCPAAVDARDAARRVTMVFTLSGPADKMAGPALQSALVVALGDALQSERAGTDRRESTATYDGVDATIEVRWDR